MFFVNMASSLLYHKVFWRGEKRRNKNKEEKGAWSQSIRKRCSRGRRRQESGDKNEIKRRSKKEEDY